MVVKKRKIKAPKAAGRTGRRLGPGFTFRLICLAVRRMKSP